MKRNVEITNNYKKKINLIKKYNQAYFSKDNPIINDSEYDNLKSEILDLEKKYNFLKKLNLNKNLIGSPPSDKFNKIQHLVPMLSLANAFDINDMKDFINKINNFLNTSNSDIKFSSEPKIDGISASLIYENGYLVKGLSRGDGVVGEDILENLKTIKEIPQKLNKIDVPDLLEVRGEVYIGKKEFGRLKENFANPNLNSTKAIATGHVLANHHSK